MLFARNPVWSSGNAQAVPKILMLLLIFKIPVRSAWTCCIKRGLKDMCGMQRSKRAACSCPPANDLLFPEKRWIRDKNHPWGSKTEKNVFLESHQMSAIWKLETPTSRTPAGIAAEPFIKVSTTTSKGICMCWLLLNSVARDSNVTTSKWAHSRVLNAITQQDCPLVTALPGNVYRSVLHLKILTSVHGIHIVFLMFHFLEH